MTPSFLSFQDVLLELKIDEDGLKKLVYQGELRGFRNGPRVQFRADEIFALKNSRTSEGPCVSADDEEHSGEFQPGAFDFPPMPKSVIEAHNLKYAEAFEAMPTWDEARAAEGLGDSPPQ